MAQGFQYSPLNVNASEIRLVTLEPGSWDDPIHCTVYHAPLGETPLYEALSYVWGDSNDKEEIRLQNHSFHITHNLFVALKYLRLEKARVLWIDALSINQEDTAERNKEILRMRSIFSSARTVLSWLGEPTAHSSKAMHMIEEMSKKFRSVSENMPQWSEMTPNDYDQMGFHFADYNWPSILDILNREYWTRVWVLQEVCSSGGFSKGNDRCLVGCGRDWIPKTIIHEFGLFLLRWRESRRHFYWYDSNEQKVNFIEPLKTFKEMSDTIPTIVMLAPAAILWNVKMNVSEILMYGGRFRCTDPRDRIYGLLGLSDSATVQTLAPDYSKTVETVITEAARTAFSNSGSLQPLRLPELNRTCRVERSPTWAMIHAVEAFVSSYTPWLNADGHYRADGNRACTIKFSGTQNLHCRGILIGTVNQTSVSMSNLETFGQVFQLCVELQPHYPDTLWRALIMDVDGTNPSDPVFPAPDYLKERFETWIFGRAPPDWFQSPSPVGSTERKIDFVKQYLDFIEVYLLNRCIFTTDSGYIGLGPAYLQTGDLVAVLFGSDFPLVLQPMGSAFGVVGDAYVQGVMKGELVTGDDGSVEEREFVLC